MKKVISFRIASLFSLALHGIVLILLWGIVTLPERKSKEPVILEVLENPKLGIRTSSGPKSPTHVKSRLRAVRSLRMKVPPLAPSEEMKSPAARQQVVNSNTVPFKRAEPSKPNQGGSESGENSGPLPYASEDYLITRMPELKTDVRIAYPPDSKKNGVEGKVVMDLLIDSSGAVRQVKLIEGPNSELSLAAVGAAQGFRFSPAMMEDHAVAVRIRYAYRFVLEH